MMVFDASAIYAALSRNETKCLSGQCTAILAAYELGNIVWKNTVLRKVFSCDEAQGFAKVCQAMLEKMRVFSPSLENIMPIATRLHISFYDAAYVFLAIELKAPLVTIDKALSHKVHTLVKIISFDDLP